jgi:xanthine dehydrogenase large subunit
MRMFEGEEDEDWYAFHEGVKEKLGRIRSEESVMVRSGGKLWYGVRDEEEWASFYEGREGDCVLVSGGSDVGVWVNKKFLRSGVMVDMSKMENLREVEVGGGTLRIGAGVTYSRLMETARKHIPGLWRMWRRLGSRQIRDMGTIVGNVMTASPIGDSTPGLMALGSVLELRKGNRVREVALEDFFTGYRQTVCEEGEYVRGIRIPLKYGHSLRCVKLSKRYDQDISTVSCACILEDGHVRVVYGGMADRVKRARGVEEVLEGGVEGNVERACDALDSDFAPLSDVRGSAWYRREAAKGILHRLCGGGLDLSYEEDYGHLVEGRGLGLVPTEVVGESGSLGRALAHESAWLHVRGEALYTDDIAERAGSLVTYVKKSEVARGRLLSLDVGEVERSEGVRAVLTASTIRSFGGKNDTSPTGSGDDPIFVEEGGEIGFYGAVLFAVVGEDMDRLREASLKAKVEYEEGEAVLSTEEAQEEVCPRLVFGGSGGRVGDMGLQGALDVGGQDHFYLEGQVSFARSEEGGRMSVWSSSQHPGEIQHVVAEVLGESASSVSVCVRRVGGGFGGKETQAAQWAAIAALGARCTGLSVRLCLDRDDDMVLTGKRHAMRLLYDVGFDSGGRVRSADVEIEGDCGCSQDLSGAVVDRAMFHVDNAYDLGSVKVGSRRWKTNKVSATAFRGFGGPQGMMGGEWIMEEVARRVGMDPLDVRYKNFYGDGNGETTPYGMRLEDNCIRDLVSKLEVRSDYRMRREKVREENERAWREGGLIRRGLSLTPVKFGISFTTTFLNQGGALLNVYKDGSVLLNHGGTEMGQGLFVKVLQLVADSFCIHPSRVKVSASHTDKVPNASATAASSGTDLNGAAALNASETIKRRMMGHLASVYGVGEEDVRFEYERVVIGNEVLTFEEAVERCYMGRVSLSSTGFYRTPKIGYDREKGEGRPFYYFAYGASVSEVAVDISTGESRLLRVDILHDVGRSINPGVDKGQIEGGFIQGLGWLTSEELVWSEEGRLLTHAPSTYKIPAAGCCPLDMRIDFYDGENRESTPYSSKAVGEPPLMLALSVFHGIADAIYQTSSETVGKRRAASLKAPATPEHILRAVKELQDVD